MDTGGDTKDRRRAKLWFAAWVAAAIAYAVPVGWKAYDDLVRVNVQARATLIQQHRLWEVDANFSGRPAVWTRMASHLLTDNQVLRRLAAKYGSQSQELEIEFRRDVAIARAEVIVKAFGIWAAPLAVAYAIAFALRRRKPAAAPKVEPASVRDPRYLPPK